MKSAVAGLPGRYLTSETIVGAAFLGIVALLIIPVPSAALDLLLAVSIAISAVVFLTALFSERPTDFSTFPTLLLISTLLRLSLNIASTRLILNNGHEGPESAGRIIYSFSSFVVGGNLAVGVIVFLALVIINFVVITKGAGRIAEVAARFTLDALPGKQMAIDAELQAGTIDDAEARRRRAQVEQQADFYGAMDGANKFIRGDAIAGLIITAINLIGGLFIGAFQHQLAIGQAATTYSMLTIGDGLVSQMPALVVSAAAGLAISRASGKSEFGQQVLDQMLGMRTVLGLSAVFLLFIGVLPGLPLFPFAVLAGAMMFAAYRQGKANEAKAAKREEKPDTPAPSPEEQLSEVLQVDAITIELGLGLIPLADPVQGGEIPSRVEGVRKQIARNLGIVVPKVRLVDNLQLDRFEYVLKLSGYEAGRGTLMTDRYLVLDPTGDAKLEGVEVKEPVFGARAFWIAAEDKRRAEARGYTAVEPTSVLMTHLSDVVQKNAEQLLRRDDVHQLVAWVRERAPKLVDELVPNQIGYSELSAVLKLLLAENVSIRDLRTILETISMHVGRTKRPEDLAERSRAALARQITEQVRGRDGRVHALMVDRGLEQVMHSSLSPAGDLMFEHETAHKLIRRVRDVANEAVLGGEPPCLLVAPDIRRPLAQFGRVHFPNVPVVSYGEIAARDADLSVVGTVSI